jgi:DNA-binding transcriptional MerR regulator
MGISMGYSKHDVSRNLKRSIRTIKFWTDEGLVVPDIVPSQGRGKARVYSSRNLLEFAMVAFLSELEVELALIRAIMTGLRKGFDEVKGEGGKKHRVAEFSDFFENEDWGNVRELVFVVARFYGSSRPVSGFRIMEVKTGPKQTGGVEGFFNSYRQKGELIQRFIWLGEIKRRATSGLPL